MAATASALSARTDEVLDIPEMGQWALAWRRLRRHRLGLIGLVMLVVIFGLSYASPIVAPYSPTDIDLMDQFGTPSVAHPFGTDELGRDTISRLLYGGRVTLSVSLLATILVNVVGIPLGAYAAYRRGWLETAIMRVTDVMLALPLLLMLLIFSRMLREMEGMKQLFGAENVSVVVMVAILTVFGWMTVCRLIHGAVLSLREREFVEASRALGTPTARIVLRHLVPNAIAPILVAATLGFGQRIVFESTLSFLGLGIAPPYPSLGNMLTEAQGYMFRNPLLAVYPGVVIFLVVLAVNFLGDALRDALDPRARN
ncbi:MAG: ABC transporter permease [Chloroflexota bacterium]|nr:MAG: ABC transporter permease [Chloroflexota bacterium]